MSGFGQRWETSIRFCRRLGGRWLLPALSFGLLTGFIGPVEANPMFSGVTGIEARAGQSGVEQVIEFKADMPFRYQMQLVNENQVVLRLYNARLADGLLGAKGEVHIQPGGAIESAVLGVPDRRHLLDEEYQEIILKGSGLGSRKIRIVGADELAVLPSQPKPNQVAMQTPEAFSLKSSPEKTMTAPAQSVKSANAETGKPSKQQKPKVLFPNLDAMNTTPSSFQKPELADAADDRESMSLLALGQSEPVKPKPALSQPRIDLEDNPASLRRELPKPATRPAAAQTSAVQTSAMNGPQIASIANVPGRRFSAQTPSQAPVSIAMPPAQGAQFPAPSLEAPWYGGHPLESAEWQRTAQTVDGLNQPQEPPAEMTVPEPEYQVLMPIPRYRGGAAPIRAVTLNERGQPIQIKPKNAAMVEYDIDSEKTAINGGFNTLFQAESDSKQTVSRLMDNAVTHYRSNRLDQALSEIQEALTLDDANADLYAALAEIQIKLARLMEAEKAYHKANMLSHGKYDHRYAQVLVLGGKREEAVRVLEAGYHSSPRKAEVAYLLGTLYEELGRTEKALTYLKQSAAMQPDSADIQYNLGLAYELSGDINTAKMHYKKALSLNPSAYEAAKALERVQQ